MRVFAKKEEMKEIITNFIIKCWLTLICSLIVGRDYGYVYLLWNNKCFESIVGYHNSSMIDHSCSCGQASWLCAEDFSSSAHGPLHRPVWVSPRRERERETKTDRERGQPRWRPQPFDDLVSRVTRRPFSFILLIRTRHSVQPTFKRREIRPHLLRAASQRMWGHLF